MNTFMAQTQKKATKGPIPSKSNNTKAKQPTASNGNWFFFLFKPWNLLFLFLACMFLAWCNNSVPGYHWVYNSLLKGGVQTCQLIDKEIDKQAAAFGNKEKKAEIAQDIKYQAKIGIDYAVLKFIKENTPEDAVIIFPPNDVITQKTQYLSLRQELTMKAFPSYFLYPRKIVYEREKGRNPLYEKANYVFILHGWGYDKLNYKVSDNQAVNILPIHNPSSIQ